MIMNRQQLPANQNVAPYSYPGVAPTYPMFQPASAQTPPAFPGAQIPTAQPIAAPIPGSGPIPGTAAAAGPFFEESYIENILRLNLGKTATVYMTFENNNQWNAKVFKGRLEAAGRDHIIISDPATGMRYLLLMVNLDYITFDEELNYEYPGFMPGSPR